MERAADPELKDVRVPAARRMPPDEIETRRNRRVCRNANIVTQADRCAETGLARAGPPLTDRLSRQTNARSQKESTRRVRVIVRDERRIPGGERVAVHILRPS